MNELTNNILSFSAIVISSLAIFIALAVIYMLFKKRDAEYKKKYETFLREKRQVEARLERVRQSQTGVE